MLIQNLRQFFDHKFMLRTRVCSRQLSNSCQFSKQMERSISSVWRLVLPCFSKSEGLTYKESVKGAIDSLWPESSWVSEMLPSSQRTAILSLNTKLSMKASNRAPGSVYQQFFSVVKVFQSQVLYDSVWDWQRKVHWTRDSRKISSS